MKTGDGFKMDTTDILSSRGFSAAAVSLGQLEPGDELLAERNRIAQELHDTLLQGFFAVSMQLHSAVERLPADLPAKPQFSTVLAAMDRALEEGRRAVQGLQSRDEYRPPLGQALARVPKDLGLPIAGFRVVVEGRERALRAGLGEELYRIGREAIFNAYRHARAKQIETGIEYRSKELRITVRDDGCGIDPKALLRTGHWGLQGMQDRAGRIGARFRIFSRVALGTEIELCLPNRVAFDQ